jgi:signal transduction histidine kinase
MSGFWSRHSIASQLTRMNLLVSAIALVLACASFLLYDTFSFRQNLIRSLRTEAQIIGSNSVSAIVFNDEESANNTLSALGNSPDVIAAVIHDPKGADFSAYQRGRGYMSFDTPPLANGEMEHTWLRGDRILLGSRILFQGKTVGTVYILAQTTEVQHRARRYVLIATAVLLLCLGTSLLLTSRFRSLVASPITELANVAQSITRDKDYSIRVTHHEDVSELAVLIRSFNEMLDRVQQRDRELLAARDELEQRVQERTLELQDANRELEAFSYSVAHDLKGPLDAIGSASYALKNMSGANFDPQMNQLLVMLPRAVKGMSTLIDDLLDLSRAKNAPLHREPINLSDLARAILDDLVSSNPDRTVEIVIQSRVYAVADKGLLRVALSNLLGNSWKYSSRKDLARIEFGTVPSAKGTLYFVRDNGAGFDPQLKDRLFQPFQRLHTQTEFGGTGIGLATVQRIIARHGGEIWAESETDHGATFYFTLP